MGKNRLTIFAILFTVFVPGMSWAHGGGLDSLGCHNDRQRGGYHCHRGPLAGMSFASKADALKALQKLQGNQKPAEESSARQFDYRSQVGMAEVNPGGQLCLMIQNEKLTPGTPVSLVLALVSEPQSVNKAVILRRLIEPCSSVVVTGVTGESDSFYVLKLTSSSLGPRHVAIAVVNPAEEFEIEKDLVSADLDRDGQKEFFRLCMSQEGVHLTVWSAAPLQGKPKWHRYFYLGYDVEPTCTDKDHEEPPNGH